MLIELVVILPSVLLVICGLGMSRASGATDRASEESYRGLMMRALARRHGDRRSRRERRLAQGCVEAERRFGDRRVEERRVEPIMIDLGP
jgi:hypothetical protein